MRAMVLAAGLGTRLRPITYGVPKPMVTVVNRPVMEHIIRLLARHDFTETIANLHWFPETIESHFGDGSAFGVELSYSHEERLLGTSGGVRKAAGFLGDSFLVISGDALTDIDLTAMQEFHESHDGIATLATKRVDDTSQFGVAITGADGRIQGFQEKPDPAEALSDLANCGIYMFRSEIFDFFPEPGMSKAAGEDDPAGFADWAMDVFPALLEGDIPFYSHEIEDYWNDIGNLEELRDGNLDALHGAVEVEIEGEVLDGVRTGSPESDEGKLSGPVLLGAGCELGDDVRIDGPTVIGDQARIGDGCRLREVIVLPGAEIAPRTTLIGAIAATRK
ncbi:MAG TPA: NDP-sugar synthase [Solirubrobacterales bacterium]|nr:NDP-sugar synthase [Solirubrobacterales bacterium]